jgi:hypothetical protein
VWDKHKTLSGRLRLGFVTQSSRQNLSLILSLQMSFAELVEIHRELMIILVATMIVALFTN